MKIPLILITFLPKKYQERYVHKQWDNKSDDDIIVALADAEGWIGLASGIASSVTIREIASDCQARLDKYITPQVTKRGLL